MGWLWVHVALNDVPCLFLQSRGHRDLGPLSRHVCHLTYVDGRSFWTRAFGHLDGEVTCTPDLWLCAALCRKLPPDFLDRDAARMLTGGAPRVHDLHTNGLHRRSSLESPSAASGVAVVSTTNLLAAAQPSPSTVRRLTANPCPPLITLTGFLARPHWCFFLCHAHDLA